MGLPVAAPAPDTLLNVFRRPDIVSLRSRPSWTVDADAMQMRHFVPPTFPTEIPHESFGVSPAGTQHPGYGPNQELEEEHSDYGDQEPVAPLSSYADRRAQCATPH